MYISGQRLNAAFHEMVYSFRFPKSCARYITAQSYVLNKIPSIDEFDQKKIQQKVSIQSNFLFNKMFDAELLFKYCHKKI